MVGGSKAPPEDRKVQIDIRSGTRAELERLRRPGDTYDHILRRLLRFHARFRMSGEELLREEFLP